MKHPDHFFPRGEYRLYESGSFTALEVPNDDLLHIFRPYDERVSITWRSVNYYTGRGIPSPNALHGKRICEVGPGLAEYALKCGNITIIEPLDYGEIGQFLSEISATTTHNTVRNLTSLLIERANAYRTSRAITHVQKTVEEAVFDIRGSFDVVISTHLIEHYASPGRAQAMIRELGTPDADFYIF